MIRERALKVLLVVVGLLFLAGVYPLLRLQLSASEQMLASVYVTLGIFLLLAARNTSANRRLFVAAVTTRSGGMAIRSARCEQESKSLNSKLNSIFRRTHGTPYWS
jgi:hypothetical protein